MVQPSFSPALESDSERLKGKVIAPEESPREEIAEPVQEVMEPPAWKRVLDWTLIALSLPLTLPVCLFIAAWIKAVSEGDIFFTQTRMGLGGEKFEIYKFRSMRSGADTAVHDAHLMELMKSERELTKLDVLGDPRLIPGGCMLRASGLDELAQLINVLRGEMSLVGPRPCTPKEADQYNLEQKRRFEVLPGLTGYWQVNGKNKTTFKQMVAMDKEYVEKVSFWLDLKIVVRTPFVLISQVMEARQRAANQKNARSEGTGEDLPTDCAPCGQSRND